MIEWEGHPDARFPFPIRSLYGERREPREGDLEGADLMVVDLQEVGSRYYTFLWTMALCFRVCEKIGLPTMVLDRPNPICGDQVEGPVGDKEYASFVGLYPLPVRHGMTIGEIGRHLQQRYFPNLDLQVIAMKGWRRHMYYEETGLPWAMPSPNMPTMDTAIVYPGGCLLEGTELSEGRGTTKPFEMFGAPYIDGFALCAALNSVGLPGVHFRPIQFEPTFQKHALQVCEGAFVHVLRRETFEPVLTYIAVMHTVRRLYGDAFRWKSPPYEYEYEKVPIDILAGNCWVRQAIDEQLPIKEIALRIQSEEPDFSEFRNKALLYTD
jgi:uncharacterized protein YbbC (DUF1343 family)